MNECVFCRIIAGVVPAYKVYEDEHTLAFLDIRPNNPGHTLVIPKEHYENIYTLPDEELCRVMLTVKKMALAIKNGTDADGINIAMNNEEAAGQVVDHAHFHIIPRFKDDGFQHFPQKEYRAGEAEAVLKQIKTAIE